MEFNQNINIETKQLSPGSDNYQVTVSEGQLPLGNYTVTVSAEEHSRFGAQVPVDELIAATFRFLLDRESADSILSQFTLATVEQYFPDYPETIADYF